MLADLRFKMNLVVRKIIFRGKFQSYQKTASEHFLERIFVSIIVEINYLYIL